MNRYNGITGRYESVPEPETYLLSLPPVSSEVESEENRTPSGQSGSLGGLGGFGGLGGMFSKNGLGGILSKNGLGSILSNNGLGSILSKNGLGSIISKVSRPNLELEDLILVAVLYLLYRESHDVEFLLIAGAMLFL